MTQEDFTQWLAAYGAAWETGDPDAAAALFTDDAAYFETPFDPPMVGRPAIRLYWAEGADAGQRDVSFAYQVTAVIGSVGYARWQAQFIRVPGGSRVELDGFLAAEFDESGRCVVFREWWHRNESPAAS